MVKSPEQMKNMVEEYIKVAPLKYKDTTDQIKLKSPDVDWQFVAGQSIHITMMKARPDRVLLLDAIGFDEQISNGLKSLMQTEPNFINSINELIMLKSCTRNFIKKDDLITGINLTTYIDSEALTRPKFFEEWDKLIALQNQIVRMIGSKLKTNQSNLTETDTTEKSMYG